MIRLLSIFILVSVLCFPAHAQENDQAQIIVPTGQFDDLKHTHSGRIDKIIDGLTILLTDNTIIRLASLDIPDFHIWRDAPYSEAALKLLEDNLPPGTEVMLYQTRMAKKGRLNRMNHELGHIVTKKDDLWIQGLLLSHGLARVYTAPNAPEMVDQMLTAEHTARAAKQGIWEETGNHPVLTPQTAEKAMGEMAIIEGTVKTAASVKNSIYLNFGKDWKTDFTIKISPEMRKTLARRGINPLALGQETLRVRGFVRDYNGPLIELEAPEHLEYPLPAPDETPILKPNS